MDPSDDARAPDGDAGVDRLDLDDLRPRVEHHLREFLDARLAAADDLSPSERTVLEPLRALVLGRGKRLRAAFCYWGWRGAGGHGTGGHHTGGQGTGGQGTGGRADEDEGAVAAGAALELLHAGALVHDDVMDESDLRRGEPTLHRQLAAVHVARRWRGSPFHFGISAAIVAGDLCLVWADQMLRSSGISPERLHRAGAVFDSMRSETMRGQYLDLTSQASGVLDVDEALRVARAKTAASTVAGPLQFGGVLAGAGRPLLDRYARYGLALGVAFQLQDDLLGAFGDEDVTGKPSGDDLRDGKCTVLLAEARRRAGPAAYARIDELVNDRTDDAVRELRALIDETGARAHVEKLIAQLGGEALEALDAEDGGGVAGNADDRAGGTGNAGDRAGGTGNADDRAGGTGNAGETGGMGRLAGSLDPAVRRVLRDVAVALTSGIRTA
ncbi:MAG TPA: polyprenyl synthetase family protein [Actinopolymorphaceae bacterium]|nr:polyprenyl synthetase family protein [Actinopolymorphaceae bacterium]